MEKLKVPAERCSSNKGSSTSISARKVSKEEFEDFCEGDEDPMLKFLAEEELAIQVSRPRASSIRSSMTIRYENSYQTEPSYKFFPDRVSSIIQEVLFQGLDGIAYDSKQCPQLACELSSQIKDQVKIDMNFPRHKLVSFVAIGERQDQGAFVGSRCVWNEKFDNFASSSFKNDTLFAVGVVYALYLE